MTFKIQQLKRNSVKIFIFICIKVKNGLHATSFYFSVLTFRDQYFYIYAFIHTIKLLESKRLNAPIKTQNVGFCVTEKGKLFTPVPAPTPHYVGLPLS